MYFSTAIDRPSVLVEIVRGLCDGLSTINSTTFNGQTKYGMTVSYRRPDKLGYRSNSLSFFVTHASLSRMILHTIICKIHTSRRTTLVCFSRQNPHHMYSNNTQKRTHNTTEDTQTQGLVPSDALSCRNPYLLGTGTGLHGCQDDHAGRGQTGSGQVSSPFSTPHKVSILSSYKNRLIEIFRMYFDTSLKTSRSDDCSGISGPVVCHGLGTFDCTN